MGDGHPTGPLDGLQAYSGPSQKGGGALFLKASTNYVLGDDREHFIIEHSPYYYYITIFIKPPPTNE